MKRSENICNHRLHKVQKKQITLMIDEGQKFTVVNACIARSGKASRIDKHIYIYIYIYLLLYIYAEYAFHLN